MLKVGDAAPDFEAPDCHGRIVRLSRFRGKRVVLFFFPKAFTLGCTEEVGHFRDNQHRIESLGAELVGVSVDKPERQCEFARQENIDFSLIGDQSRVISTAYGVLWPILRVDRRVTFIVGPAGLVEAIIKHETRVSRHLDDVLAHLGDDAASGAAWNG
jgi:peroxiredoxin Q/BCP